MFNLVVGASASGKSEYAENIAVALATKKLYIATMQPFDDECRLRIQKHQRLRATKGFDTLEMHTSLENVDIEKHCGYDLVLVECMSNLLANLLYAMKTDQSTVVCQVMRGVSKLQAAFQHVVIVSNDVAFDGDDYTEETLMYMGMLGQINAEIAKMADVVVEVVCSVPIFHKSS